MTRPKRKRMLGFVPEITYFKPAGVPLRFLDEVVLSLDEIEAVRLADFENQGQIKSAKKMHISQSTFQRILSSARSKTAEALVVGKAICLKGGEIKMPNIKRGKGAGVGRGRGRGQVGGGKGSMGGQFAAGPGGKCVCTNPDCKHEIVHQTGVPCYQLKCPECDSSMIRKVE